MESKFTLGMLIKEVDQYEGTELTELITLLKKLLKMRNDFTHKLYWSDKPLEKLISETKDGVKLTNKILESLEELNKKII